MYKQKAASEDENQWFKNVTENKCTVCISTAKILGGYTLCQEPVGALIFSKEKKKSQQ